MVLAGLLHDIGKLLQRGSFGSLETSGQHPQVSSVFVSAYSTFFGQIVDADLLKTLVQHHHESHYFPPELQVQGIQDPETRCLANLVSLADNYSSSERGDTTLAGADFKSTPLMSVMERIFIPDGRQPETSGQTPSLRFKPRPLSGTDDHDFASIYPEAFPEYGPGELNLLLKEFGKDFGSLAKSGVSTFDAALYHVLHLIYKYAWCVPSNTQEDVPDISLFDHLRTTAAIAACLYRYHVTEGSLNEHSLRHSQSRRFLLLGGDLSGIQSYIFDVANIGAGGVSRRLRARSLYVQLVTEACTHRILELFDLPPVNVLIVAGGNFNILLPNHSRTREMIGTVNEEIDRWFLEQLNGELALNLASIPLDGDDFRGTSEKGEGFSGILRRLGDELALTKQQRFASVLRDGKHWHGETFVINQDFKGRDACRSCRKFPVQGPDTDLCQHCRTDWQTGKDLPAANAIAFDRDGAGGIPLPYGTASLLPTSSGRQGQLAIALNSTDLTSFRGIPAQSKFLANYIPRVADEEEQKRLAEISAKRGIKDDPPVMGEPITFELMAAVASGRDYLGFLKMDADNMGGAMVFGLKREKPETGLDTTSRVATLSRQIDWFFSGWVQRLLSRESEFKYCYTVFSGGDDLFVAGPWNAIINLADRIHSDYSRYTGNPGLTISAGVAIGSSSYPISQAAGEAQEAVESSKNAGRSRITLLGHTLAWDEWAAVKNKWIELAPVLETEKISSAFLYSLVEYGKMWQKFRKGNTGGLRFQPLLAYRIRRNINARQSPTFCGWAQSIASLRLEELQQKQVILDYLGLLARLLILGKKGSKE